MIPLYKRHHDPLEIEAVEELFKSGELSQGRYIEQLEEEFAKYVGAPYAVAVNSCTNAIGICLEYMKTGLKIPAMTFVSVMNEAGRRSGKNANFAIILFDDLVVGKAYPLGPAKLIWDCAHQVDKNMYDAGTFECERLYCFSLYPGKPISGAEGGLICTSNAEFVKWAKSYRQCGRTAYGASYDVVNRGVKANMTNLQACIGLHALWKLDENKSKLEKVRKRYNEAFGLNNTSDYVYRVNTYNDSLYAATSSPQSYSRDLCRDKAMAKGIQTSIHFKPIYYFEAYKGIWDPKNFPNTEKEWKTTVSIPFYPDLSEKDQDRVINLVIQWI